MAIDVFNSFCATRVHAVMQCTQTYIVYIKYFQYIYNYIYIYIALFNTVKSFSPDYFKNSLQAKKVWNP